MSRLLAYCRRGPVLATFIVTAVTLILFAPILRGYVPLAVGSLPKLMPVQTSSFAPSNALRDALVQSYPYHAFITEAFRHGVFPLWNDKLFAGTPFFANGQAGVLSPIKALWWWLPPATSFSLSVILQFLVAGLGMYLLTGMWSWRKSSRLIASIGFMLCGPFVLWSTTSIMSSVMAWLPWLLWCIHGLHRDLHWKWAAGIAVVSAATFFSGQVQIAILVFLFSVIWAAAFWQRSQWQRRLVLFLAAFALGLGLSSVQLLPTLEASSQAYREPGTFSLTYLLNPAHLFAFNGKNVEAMATLAGPNILGTTATYRGPANFLEGNFYVGPIILLLALASVRLWRKRVWRVAAIVVGAVVLAIAFPTLKSLFVDKLLPPLSLATVWRFSIFLCFGLAVLAGLGAEVLTEKRRKAGVVLVVLAAAVGLWQWQHVLPFGPRADLYPPTPILQAAQPATSTGRMWARDGNLDEYMPYGIATILGYDSLYPKTYLDLWQANSTLVRRNQLVVNNPNPKLLAVTGVASILTLTPLPSGWHAQQEAAPWVLAVPDVPQPTLHVVQRVVSTDDPAKLQAIDPVTEALIAGNPPRVDVTTQGTAIILEQKPTALHVQAKATGATVLVTPLQYYPGWKATVDGKAVALRRVNIAFIGVPLDSGDHDVRITYQPHSFTLGLIVSGATALALIIITIVRRRRASRT